MFAKLHQFALHPEGKSLPSAATVDEEPIEICVTGCGVVPLRCDEIDDAGIARGKLSRIHVGRQPTEPSFAKR